MRLLGLVLIAVLTGGSVQAADCKAEAETRKLEGNALITFLAKCEADATAQCDKLAAERRLQGAAKDSFTKKCVEEAVGS